MDVKRNRSRKREAVYNALLKSKVHPTAEMLHERLKKDYPELSLGTVYRNLAVLEEDGMVVSVSHEGGHAHYDARIEPHAHFVCRVCQSVTDLELPDSGEGLYDSIEQQIDCKILTHSLSFEGICKECRKKTLFTAKAVEI